MRIEVERNNIERALRKLTRKLLKDGWRADVRRHNFYVKPSVRKRFKRERAIARQR